MKKRNSSKRAYAHASVPASAKRTFGFSKKCATLALSAALASTLCMPSFAFAADYLWIEDAEQTVGTSGNGWAWVDQDNLNLNGYNGGQIYAEGNLNINVTGENTVDVNPDCLSDEWFSADGIAVNEGDLSITGDGTLNISAGYDGIYADEGSISIDGITANIVTDGSDSTTVSGISTYMGDVTITNATINIEASARGKAAGIWAGESYSYGENTSANVVISNSDINIKAYETEDIEHPESNGIVSHTNNNQVPASIVIDNSNIAIDATAMAMAAIHYSVVPVDEIANAKGGTISITNSTISNDGVKVCDYLEDYYSGVSAYSTIDETYIAKGQVLGTAEGVIGSETDPSIVSDVTITANEKAAEDAKDTADTEKKTELKANVSNVFPATGDGMFVVLIAALVSAVVALAGIFFFRKN